MVIIYYVLYKKRGVQSFGLQQVRAISEMARFRDLRSYLQEKLLLSLYLKLEAVTLYSFYICIIH